MNTMGTKSLNLATVTVVFISVKYSHSILFRPNSATSDVCCSFRVFLQKKRLALKPRID